jgi:UDP-2,3-diacylglucosamine pyrophosphatase LpxH
VITDYKILTEVSCGAFYYIQKWAPHNAARWIRRVTKKWQRNSQLIQKRAVEYARSKGCRYVTCGHTHLPLEAEVDGIRYFNSGTWIEHPPCPFVSVKGPDVRLQYWPAAESAEGARGDGREAARGGIAPAEAETLP